MKHDVAPLVYRGEVWTDGRGRAVVALPEDAPEPADPIAYTLEPAAAGVTAVVAVPLDGGHFAIATDEPHVKVSWRIAGAIPHAETQLGRRGA
jgi:hypothetical protein